MKRSQPVSESGNHTRRPIVMDGTFGALNNVAWTNIGPVAIADLDADGETDLEWRSLGSEQIWETGQDGSTFLLRTSGVC